MSLFKRVKEAEEFKEKLKEDISKDIEMSPAPSGIQIVNNISGKTFELSMNEWVFLKSVVERSLKYASLPRIKNSDEAKAVKSLNEKLRSLIS